LTEHFFENPFEVLENEIKDFQNEINILNLEKADSQRLFELEKDPQRNRSFVLKSLQGRINNADSEIRQIEKKIESVQSEILSRQFNLFSRIQAAKSIPASITNSIPKTADIQKQIIPTELKTDNTLRNLLLIGGLLVLV
jgi:predicted  nucleic acid-binding Zn-ribbon protein